MTNSASGIEESAVRSALKGQYHAAVAMLRDSIESCSDALWCDGTPRNPFWRVAHHALYFLHLYLLDGPESPGQPGGRHRAVQDPDGVPRPPGPESPLPERTEPYTRVQILEYLDWCDSIIDRRVDEMDIASPASGFDWYPISKLEHQLVNIRHTAHHAAQLADRVRMAQDIGVTWVGSRGGTGPAAG